MLHWWPFALLPCVNICYVQWVNDYSWCIPHDILLFRWNPLLPRTIIGNYSLTFVFLVCFNRKYFPGKLVIFCQVTSWKVFIHLLHITVCRAAFSPSYTASVVSPFKYGTKNAETATLSASQTATSNLLCLKLWEQTYMKNAKKFLFTVFDLNWQVSTIYISCPNAQKQTLGVKLPFLVMIIKNLKKYFSFEVQV